MRKLFLLTTAWWVLLGLQIWFAWDLNETYASCLPLLMLGPELPFAACGVAIGLAGIVMCVRRKRWVRTALQASTLAVAALIAIESPVMLLGSELYLWRNEASFLAEVAREQARLAHDARRSDMPGSTGVFVEGSPPRYGFAMRWIGQFHWAAFVYDPGRTIESESKEQRRGVSIFRYSLLGYEPMWGDWFVVWAIK